MAIQRTPAMATVRTPVTQHILATEDILATEQALDSEPTRESTQRIPVLEHRRSEVAEDGTVARR